MLEHSLIVQLRKPDSAAAPVEEARGRKLTMDEERKNIATKVAQEIRGILPDGASLVDPGESPTCIIVHCPNGAVQEELKPILEKLDNVRFVLANLSLKLCSKET